MIQKSIDECTAARINAKYKLTEVLVAYGYHSDLTKVVGWDDTPAPRTPYLQVVVETASPAGWMERKLLVPRFVVEAEDHVAAAKRWALGAIA